MPLHPKGALSDPGDDLPATAAAYYVPALASPVTATTTCWRTMLT
ncbi:MAG: hypothetical protein R3A10_08660 [Caldilineaceae bacterium]